MSAARALATLTAPVDVAVWDAYDGAVTQRRREQLAARGIRVELGPWRDDLLERPRARTVVKSPGVAPSAAPVVGALARGIPVIDELELARRRIRRQLVAVTGTDGKSTTCALLAHAVGAPGEPLEVAGNTQFGPPLSAVARDGGPVIVETSSYQLEFSSPAFADLAVLTSLTPEHLFRHATMERYAQAKRRLFLGDGRAVRRAVVNVDGAIGRRLAEDLAGAGSEVLTVGSRPPADLLLLDADWGLQRGWLRARCQGQTLELEHRLPGRHNAANVLVALATCDLLGLERARVLAALGETPGVPGRWEVIGADTPLPVVVDFAHSAAAIRSVLLTARRIVAERPGARVHTVLGSGGGGGGGGSGQRAEPLGRALGRFGDRVAVTESNSRGVPREDLIEAMARAAQEEAAAVEVVPSRREAIRTALLGATAGDLVLILGRGSMPRLLSDPAGGGPSFDDREVVREELARIAGAGLSDRTSARAPDGPVPGRSTPSPSARP